MRNVLTAIAVISLLGCRDSPSLNANSEIKSIVRLLDKAERLKFSKTDSSLFFAHQALNSSKANDYNEGIGITSLIIGEICFEKGEYKKANSFLLESIEIFEKYENFSALGKAYNFIGLIFQSNGRFDLARSNYSKALKVYELSNDSKGIAETYGNLGHLNEKIGVYDSAIYYNSQAIRLYREISDSIGIAIIYDNKGSVYEDQGDYDNARDNFQQAYLINSTLNNELEALINRNNIADTYRKTRQFQKAIDLYKEVAIKAKSLNQSYQLKSAYRDLSRTYFPLKDYETAYLYLDSCYAISDELARQEIARGIEETKSVFEVERKQRQIELLEKEKRINLIIRTLLISLAILLLIIGVLVFFQLKTRMKKNQLLFEAEKKLAAARQEQLETDLDLKKLREEKMYQEMENMSKELTANALNIIRKNKFLSQLKKELKAMKSSKDDGLNKGIKKIIRSINYTFSIDDDWQEFESIFQQVHEGFFEHLRKEFPNLTATETRLCAMLRLNLEAKDMATIMGISQDSLRIARYRLRKKLKMDKGANLYSFMMNIG